MHTWKFFRTGGLDQVTLESGADLLNLEQLDQKLWVALSCPVKGLELDEATLKLLDADGDGRIRVPELLAAIKWATPRLKDLGVLLHGTDGLPLAAINDATPEGKILLASARQILANLGKKEAAAITVADSSNTAQIFAASALNGDGVIPPEATEDAAVQALIKDIIACLGGTADRTGAIGVTAAQIEAFFGELTAYAAWVEHSARKDIAVLGEATDAAVAALKAVRPKVQDYFGRCRLAAYDGRAAAALNGAESEYLAIAAKDLKITADEVTGFPLSRIEGGRALPLFDGVNPAWAAALATLHAAVVTPVLGAAKTALTEADWAALNAKFAPYETWLGGKAGSAVEPLGLARIKAILAGEGRAALAALVARDQALEPEFKAISDVDRLTHYHRDLRALLHNFVNFADFYSRDQWAVFQAGTLYLDSRSTELCIRVDAPNPLAAMSKAYIAYVDCKRAGLPPMKIAACFTQGDSDYLFVGRNGVFYDRQGRDWDAVVTAIVDNPISIRQAFWSPYKKFLRMIEEQVAKRAAAAEAASSAKLASTAEGAVAAKIEPPKKVDVGAVAAIGVAISGAVTALTLILGYVFQLKPWQYPLVVLGLILVISTPSMVIAWLKLRQRTLGPILEGNGWAVNGRVAINIPFGTKLTDLAVLPAGARRSLDDPYEDKDAARRRRLLWVLLLVLAAAALYVRWDRTQRGHYFWQNPPPAVAVEAAPAAVAEPAK
ncbi:hypothetical protein Verru16b_00325 [Lacunisphaera limnophila]|uniref:EF-hand domain-containing protein n=1 Tax=Lacunisphaera limnophila TaxID=1838286 RepID=A0A1I7PI28_9BACT|nr:hypothetical protein [Lacunisphaera limnophila]AOS43282.1 hypothetical protein Verru16b_00325 [Lacunisphaera limnophila]